MDFSNDPRGVCTGGSGARARVGVHVGHKRLPRTVSVACGLALACAGFLFAGTQSVRAADLDYDVPRYGSVKDYYEDREADWRACAPREFVREDLRAEGWRDLRRVEPRGRYVLMEARRARSGRPFLLTVDRCSGDVVASEPLAPRERVFVRSYDDKDWRWRRDRDWDRRADWRDRREWRDGRRPWRGVGGPWRYQ